MVKLFIAIPTVSSKFSEMWKRAPKYLDIANFDVSTYRSRRSWRRFRKKAVRCYKPPVETATHQLERSNPPWGILEMREISQGGRKDGFTNERMSGELISPRPRVVLTNFRGRIFRTLGPARRFHIYKNSSSVSRCVIYRSGRKNKRRKRFAKRIFRTGRVFSEIRAILL